MADYTMTLHQHSAHDDASVETQLSAAASPAALALFHEGLAHFRAGDPSSAVTAFSGSIAEAPAFGEAHVFLGLAHALNSNIYPAFDHLELAAQIQPDNFAAHFTLAQLCFKLRIPQKGYEASREALRCVQTIEQRAMLTQLLKEERARERNGIARPWFNKPFGTKALLMAGSGLAAALVALLLHVH